MLIICPECEKEISDKSKVCIHCGYSLEKLHRYICCINGIEYDFDDVLLNLADNSKSSASRIRFISDKCNIPIYESKRLYEIINTTKEVPSEFQCEVKSYLEPNKPKCPICGSTNINKITIGSRAMKTAIFGVVGAIDDAGKTYQCKNCGSKF